MRACIHVGVCIIQWNLKLGLKCSEEEAIDHEKKASKPCGKKRGEVGRGNDESTSNVERREREV